MWTSATPSSSRVCSPGRWSANTSAVEIRRSRVNCRKYLHAAATRTKAQRHPHEMRNGARLHFMHDGRPMVLGCSGGDSQAMGDELRRQAFSQQIEDFALALGQQCAPAPDFLGFRLAV